MTNTVLPFITWNCTINDHSSIKISCAESEFGQSDDLRVIVVMVTSKLLVINIVLFYI